MKKNTKHLCVYIAFLFIFCQCQKSDLKSETDINASSTPSTFSEIAVEDIVFSEFPKDFQNTSNGECELSYTSNFISEPSYGMVNLFIGLINLVTDETVPSAALSITCGSGCSYPITGVEMITDTSTGLMAMKFITSCDGNEGCSYSEFKECVAEEGMLCLTGGDNGNCFYKLGCSAAWINENDGGVENYSEFNHDDGVGRYDYLGNLLNDPMFRRKWCRF